MVMQIDADKVSVDGPHGVLLEPTSLTLESGEVTVVAGIPGAGHTALSLVLSGRMAPDRGRVLVDGRSNNHRLRRITALVDVPEVCDPDEVLPLKTVVGEELAIAQLPAGRSGVTHWLHEHDADELRNTRIEHLSGQFRIEMLTEMATHRPGIEALVVCCPDRYGTTYDQALTVAQAAAAEGMAVCLQLTSPTVRSHEGLVWIGGVAA